ncbi:MAG: hypothetical protein AAGF74_11615 [Pseudomonadota bacterium]
MLKTDDTIKRRPDGSIDTGFYIEQGRRARSEAAVRPFAGAPPATRRQRWSPLRVFF